MKLHVVPQSPRGFKVLALAEHLGIDYELCLLDFSKGDHRTPEFAALNPNKRMPVLEDDGFVLWESNAILQYLALKKPGSGMMPIDPRGMADVSRWQFWDLAHWDSALSILIYERMVKKLFAIGEPDNKAVADGEEKVHLAAQVLNAHLKGRRFVTGDKLTVADFSLGAGLNATVPAQIPIDGYSEIKRWYGELSQLPAWQKWLPQ